MKSKTLRREWGNIKEREMRKKERVENWKRR